MDDVELWEELFGNISPKNFHVDKALDKNPLNKSDHLEPPDNNSAHPLKCPSEINYTLSWNKSASCTRITEKTDNAIRPTHGHGKGRPAPPKKPLELPRPPEFPGNDILLTAPLKEHWESIPAPPQTETSSDSGNSGNEDASASTAYDTKYSDFNTPSAPTNHGESAYDLPQNRTSSCTGNSGAQHDSASDPWDQTEVVFTPLKSPTPPARAMEAPTIALYLCANKECKVPTCCGSKQTLSAQHITRHLRSAGHEWAEHFDEMLKVSGFTDVQLEVYRAASRERRCITDYCFAKGTAFDTDASSFLRHAIGSRHQWAEHNAKEFGGINFETNMTSITIPLMREWLSARKHRRIFSRVKPSWPPSIR